MSVRAAAVDAMWEKLEFVIDRSGHHVSAKLYFDNVLVVRTRRSHGSGKIEGTIPDKIRQQMRLNEGQFADAINCPLKAAGYLDILKRKGFLP